MLCAFVFGREIDFNNSVMIGAVFFCLSIPVAIYTGLVAARMVTFQTAITQAGGELTLIAMTIYQAADFYTARRALTVIGSSARFTLAEISQARAVAQIAKLFAEIDAHYWQRLADQLSPEERREIAIKADATVSPGRWRNLCDSALKGSGPAFRAFSARLEAIRPDYFQLFYFPLLGRVAEWIDRKYAPRRSDCSSCCENCNREI